MFLFLQRLNIQTVYHYIDLTKGGSSALTVTIKPGVKIFLTSFF